MKQVWKRRAVAAAVVVLVGTSVYLNWRYAGDVADTSKVLGQSTLVNGETAEAQADTADTAGDDQLDLAVHTQFLEGLHSQRNRSQRRDADVFDEHFLSCRGTALHAVDDDHVGTGGDGQLYVVVRAGGTHLDVDRLLPVGDLPDFRDLDGQVIRAGPVRMP